MAGAAVLERLSWLTATVAETVEETPRARTLVLDVPGFPRFRPGQHVDVRLTAEDGYQAERSYSIGSPPELDHLELTIVLFEDGEVSPYFVEEVVAGDQFELRGPIGGHFTWTADEEGPVLLVAGGSGIVPLASMLRHRAARGSDADVRLLASARSPEDALFREELGGTWTFTRSAPPGWTGHTGRVDAAMLEEVAPPPADAPRCFVCGPTPFVEHVLNLLVEVGHAPRRIHAERFGGTA